MSAENQKANAEVYTKLLKDFTSASYAKKDSSNVDAARLYQIKFKEISDTIADKKNGLSWSEFLSFQGEYGRTALHVAFDNCNCEFIKEAVQHVKIGDLEKVFSIKTVSGLTPLSKVLNAGTGKEQLEALTKILGSFEGIDGAKLALLKSVDSYGFSLLHHLAFLDTYTDIHGMLAEIKKAVGDDGFKKILFLNSNESGITALHVAVLENKTGLLDEIFSTNSSMDLKNSALASQTKDGLTILDLAVKSEESKVVLSILKGLDSNTDLENIFKKESLNESFIKRLFFHKDFQDIFNQLDNKVNVQNSIVKLIASDVLSAKFLQSLQQTESAKFENLKTKVGSFYKSIDKNDGLKKAFFDNIKIIYTDGPGLFSALKIKCNVFGNELIEEVVFKRFDPYINGGTVRGKLIEGMKKNVSEIDSYVTSKNINEFILEQFVKPLHQLIAVYSGIGFADKDSFELFEKKHNSFKDALINVIADVSTKLDQYFKNKIDKLAVDDFAKFKGELIMYVADINKCIKHFKILEKFDRDEINDKLKKEYGFLNLELDRYFNGYNKGVDDVTKGILGSTKENIAKIMKHVVDKVVSYGDNISIKISALATDDKLHDNLAAYMGGILELTKLESGIFNDIKEHYKVEGFISSVDKAHTDVRKLVVGAIKEKSYEHFNSFIKENIIDSTNSESVLKVQDADALNKKHKEYTDLLAKYDGIIADVDSNTTKIGNAKSFKEELVVGDRIKLAINDAATKIVSTYCPENYGNYKERLSSNGIKQTTDDTKKTDQFKENLGKAIKCKSEIEKLREDKVFLGTSYAHEQMVKAEKIIQFNASTGENDVCTSLKLLNEFQKASQIALYADSYGKAGKDLSAQMLEKLKAISFLICYKPNAAQEDVMGFGDVKFNVTNAPYSADLIGSLFNSNCGAEGFLAKFWNNSTVDSIKGRPLQLLSYITSLNNTVFSDEPGKSMLKQELVKYKESLIDKSCELLGLSKDSKDVGCNQYSVSVFMQKALIDMGPVCPDSKALFIENGKVNFNWLFHVLVHTENGPVTNISMFDLKFDDFAMSLKRVVDKFVKENLDSGINPFTGAKILENDTNSSTTTFNYEFLMKGLWLHYADKLKCGIITSDNLKNDTSNEGVYQNLCKTVSVIVSSVREGYSSVSRFGKLNMYNAPKVPYISGYTDFTCNNTPDSLKLKDLYYFFKGEFAESSSGIGLKTLWFDDLENIVKKINDKHVFVKSVGTERGADKVVVEGSGNYVQLEVYHIKSDIVVNSSKVLGNGEDSLDSHLEDTNDTNVGVLKSWLCHSVIDNSFEGCLGLL
ncbi:hypothetical protein Cyrtocomes_00332 [Candidatus Cyrtobacter comes]|uniref:Ankyrin repeat domain-containing protein n=1 Tax=Candidatus Cyrtobacter comes TaxID=675776 RepID=A0ABU5L770_9RICK|nr:hypothetical protein [Candidatus Cyrtobacter comes]MDZ5761968.1 hypothetical protein [Candidatus Cyrtobacter comes]